MLCPVKWAVVVVALVLLVLAFGVLWNAGEQHRKNCIQEKRSDCSVLPWANGRDAPAPPPKSFLDTR